jgi:hypothetical protein
MTAKWIKLSVAAVAAATLFGFSSSSQAVTIPLTGTDAFGNTINSGWVASYADSYAAAGWNVSLAFRGLSTDGSQFFFEKDATFMAPAGNGIDGLEIQFTKVDPSAKQLVINDEIINNQTGVDWNGFQWRLASGSTSGGPGFTFSTTNGPADGFAISPFTTMTFAEGNTVLNFAGGTVANGQTWFAGANSLTGIAIVSGANTSSFALKEIPAGGPGAQPAPIPLPAAAWSGLSTLVGLGLLSAARNAKKLLA